jgi:hypothetical protein
MSETEKWLSCTGLVVLAFVTIIAGTIMNGWVLSITWGWFIVPFFHLPKLSLVFAMGIGLVISFLTHQDIPNPKDQTTSEAVGRLVASAFITPLMFLVTGWVIHLFV